MTRFLSRSRLGHQGRPVRPGRCRDGDQLATLRDESGGGGVVSLGFGPTGPAEAAPLQIRAVLYNDAGSPPEVVSRAERVVTRTFSEMGVETVWLDVDQFTRETPTEPVARLAFIARLILVRLVSAPKPKDSVWKADSLGVAAPGTRLARILRRLRRRIGPDRQSRSR